MAELPLEGLKVLDLTWVVAGPAMGRTLADYGATVVRVESSVRVDVARQMGPFPQGAMDVQHSALYDTYNAGKLGLALDLNRPEGREIVRDLALWADVLLESFAPGQMARWGLEPDRLRVANPGLIGVSSSLMGQTGPFAAFAGFGNVGAAVAGFQAIVGREGAQPVGPFGPYTDYVAPRFGLPTLLAALEHRRTTGEGCWIDIAQAEAAIQFLAPEVAAAAAGGEVARAMGNRDRQYAPHGVFRCTGEDSWVAIAVRTDAEWRALAERLGPDAQDPALATAQGRKSAEDRLEALVEAWTGARTAQAVEAELQGLGIAAHRVANTAEVVGDPHLAARGHFVRLPHSLGGAESVFDATRYRLSETPAEYRMPAPSFGRDLRRVLVDFLGYDAERVNALEASGLFR